MLLQSFENAQFDLETSNQWRQLLALVERCFAIHQWTVWYWSVFDTDTPEGECWRITPYMRALYTKQAP